MKKKLLLISLTMLGTNILNAEVTAHEEEILSKAKACETQGAAVKEAVSKVVEHKFSPPKYGYGEQTDPAEKQEFETHKKNLNDAHEEYNKCLKAHLTNDELKIYSGLKSKPETKKWNWKDMVPSFLKK